MSRSRVEVLERPQSTKAAEELLHQQDADEGMEDEYESGGDEVSDKDDTELELERLVFGDSAGFREGLQSSALADRAVEEDDGEAAALDGLDDADVGQALSKPCLVCAVR